MADCIFKEIKFDGKEWLLIYLDCMYSLGELPQDTTKLIQAVRGLNNELEYGIALSPLLSRLGKVQASREACHAIVLLRTLAKSKNDELELEKLVDVSLLLCANTGSAVAAESRAGQKARGVRLCN